jgi:hypothetical protein
METFTTGGFTDTPWNCAVTGDSEVNRLVCKQGAISKYLSRTGVAVEKLAHCDFAKTPSRQEAP